MNFFVNVLWIFSYPNYNSKISFMIQHYVLENLNAPFKFLLPWSRALIMTSPWIIATHKKSQEWFLCLSKTTKNATLSELQGASLPRPPPGLYSGPTGELTATPRHQMSLAMILGHCMLCLRHNCLKTGNFSFFHIGTGILDYFNAGNWDPKPPPSGRSIMNH